MRAVVVYESMFGNTHAIAEAIGRGLAGSCEVVIVPVERAVPAVLDGADLIVVGGPTHAHGISREGTRHAAIAMAAKPDALVVLDPDAEGPGLRDWFDRVGSLPHAAAAFDTRGHAPAVFTGRASKGIARRLRRHGCTIVAAPESFFVVGQDTHLERGELARAEEWGRTVARHAPQPAA
jgi:menaquinone-dependent protoporphyrinogen IX oxidase